MGVLGQRQDGKGRCGAARCDYKVRREEEIWRWRKGDGG